MEEHPPIEIELFRQQSLALECPATEVLYGGAAGGGKSHLLRAGFITWALSVPGLQLYLFRRLFPDLVRNHLQGPTSFHVMLAGLVKQGHCKIVKGEIRFSNGSVIHLRHLQHTKDIYSYQGTEMHVLAFDEATHFSDEEYRYLRGRCRMVGIKIPDGCPWKFPRIILCTNPGGQGHHWCKRGWIDHGPYRIHRAAASEGGMTRCFIPAKIDDNPALLKADPQYLERLDGLGDAMLVRAMKEGDWNVIAGAMFGEQWRASRHITKPFPIPVDWSIWLGIDDGFAAPAAVVWLTQNLQTKRKYVIREIYRSGMLPHQFADRIKRINENIPRVMPRGEIIPNHETPRGLMDAAAFSDTGQESIPRGMQLRKLGIKVAPVDKWPGSRVAGCQNLHRELAPLPGDKSGLPSLQFFDCCEHTIRTIPTLMRDKDNPEDVDTDGEDHPYDALRYGLQYRQTRIKKIKPKGT